MKYIYGLVLVIFSLCMFSIVYAEDSVMLEYAWELGEKPKDKCRTQGFVVRMKHNDFEGHYGNFSCTRAEHRFGVGYELRTNKHNDVVATWTPGIAYADGFRVFQRVGVDLKLLESSMHNTRTDIVVAYNIYYDLDRLMSAGLKFTDKDDVAVVVNSQLKDKDSDDGNDGNDQDDNNGHDDGNPGNGGGNSGSDDCRPGYGHGDKNHCHSGPPGLN